MDPQTFLLLGRSGSGKGTQAKELEKHLKKEGGSRKIYYFEVGGHVRKFFEEETYSSKIARDLNDKDFRQPSFVAIWLWAEAFTRDLTGEEHLIVDGACRSIAEAWAFESALEFYARRANIIHLATGRDEVIRRLLSRGRSDDASAERISKRLNWFEKDTIPVIEYFKSNDRHNFIEVDGEKPIPDVTSQIIEKIKILE